MEFTKYLAKYVFVSSIKPKKDISTLDEFSRKINLIITEKLVKKSVDGDFAIVFLPNMEDENYVDVYIRYDDSIMIVEQKELVRIITELVKGMKV